MRRHYDALASRYDERWGEWVERTVRETLDRVALPQTGAILDVGCGTGIPLAALVRERGGRGLTGLDLSPAMLQRGREKLGHSASWVAGDAGRLPFRSGTFELVVSLSALHNWSQPVAALDEIRRVLRSGGRIAITDWCGDDWIMRLRNRALRLVQPAQVRVMRASELEALLETAGFGWIRVERWRLDWRWEMMTAVAARGDEVREVEARGDEALEDE